MVVPECVDRIHAGDSLLSSHFVQAVEQGQNLVRLDPILTDRPWNVVMQVQFVYHPFGQGFSRLRPGREWKDDRNWVLRVVLGAIQEFTGKLEEQHGFARARGT